jgi:hypothetical protein
MPLERQFDVVARRAVDGMKTAVGEAARRARERVVIVGTLDGVVRGLAAGFLLEERVLLPGSERGAVVTFRRS